ncbi:hypothetical protein L2D14_06830 [Thalassospiraceae bacterium LMO-JJ14]|nr:hypothetical protein L2D14_06830 [Thalassospiraceae bacterium LMO-JJ14]
MKEVNMDSIALYLPGILIAYSTCPVGLASPGPNIMSIIGTAMHDGRGAGYRRRLGFSLRLQS